VADLRACDFEEVLAEVQRGDFVYMDPPYYVSTHRVFRQYNASSFELADLKRLERQLARLDRRGARFVVSYACTREALAVFARWNTRRIGVMRNIAGFSCDRRRSMELLVSNTDLR
jgi:DNA adenine methylase